MEALELPDRRGNSLASIADAQDQGYRYRQRHQPGYKPKGHLGQDENWRLRVYMPRICFVYKRESQQLTITGVICGLTFET